VVAVVADGPGSTEAVRPLVRALARHVEVRSADRVAAPSAELVIGSGGFPTDPITGSGGGVPTAMVADGEVLLPDGATIDLPGAASVDTAAWPPLPPHVRRRWRRRLGLDPDLVVDTAALDPDDVPTALAVAAAAVVAPADLPLALALGCPSVVTAEAAAGLGAVDGLHVVVGGRPEAEALAGDDRRAALLSRQGRLLARAALDPARAAEALLRAWGLAPVGPVARFDERLDELGTSRTGPVRRRVADALVLMTGPTGGP
jgi:hypothetical protein